MGNISGITRRDIINLFKNGITEDNWLVEESIYYPYYGRFDVVDFLKRLYKLDTWESGDSRLKNAEQEIMMHTCNGDYSDNWIFYDERFHLIDGTDNVFLDFLCEVFHPEVRDENKEWEKYLEKINSLLQEDGYELVASSKISGRDVFSWRTYIKKPDIYPFFRKEQVLNN